MSPARILVVRLSALGDVLLATPAVRALAARFPEARIDWLVEAPYVPLLEANPHAQPVAYLKRGEHAGVRGLLALRRELASRRYDLVVDLQDKPKTRLFHGLAPQCVAFRKRTPGEALRSLFAAERPLVRAHAVDLFLEALAPLGTEPRGRELELRPSPSGAAALGAIASDRPLAGLAPGARWATKRWAPQGFAEVARGLAARGFTPLLVGGPGDAAEFARVRAAAPELAFPDTAGLDVGGLAAAVSRCRVLVANDSGPVHVASALGVPVVAVFGPTSPARWRPLSPRSEVVTAGLPCSPCSNHGGERCPLGHLDCLGRVDAAAVLAAVDRVAG